MLVMRVLIGARVSAVGGVRGSCLTYTSATARLQDTLCSVFDVFWELAILQKFRVRTQSQDLGEKKKDNINELIRQSSLHIPCTSWWVPVLFPLNLL